eukprot:2389889-Pleurochrysis_carterae.AAC.2
MAIASSAFSVFRAGFNVARSLVDPNLERWARTSLRTAAGPPESRRQRGPTATSVCGLDPSVCGLDPSVCGLDPYSRGHEYVDHDSRACDMRSFDTHFACLGCLACAFS